MSINTRSKLKNIHVQNLFLEFVLGSGITFFSAIFCMWLCQFSCELSLAQITTKSAFIIFICLYAIIFALVTVISGRVVVGNCVSMVFLLAVTVLDYQVYSFRGTEILPGDIYSVKTALSVAGNYRPQITGHLVAAVLLLVLYFLLISMFFKFRKGLFWREITFAVLIGAVVVFTQIINFLPVLAFDNEGMKQSSFPVNFCRLMYSVTEKEPEGYSQDIIQVLENTYQTEPDTQNRPIIIAIMNESFADLNVLGDLPVEEDILPFFHSLEENTVKGWAQVPVFGAGTANTEWEFLTGHSVQFLPVGSTPYRTNALTASYSSITSNLKNIGYYCIAMHPHLAYSYSRNAVYPSMGFDKMLFKEDFPNEKMLRNHVSDQEMYEEIIRQYESYEDNTPLFIFGVTIQNHGGYEYEGENYAKSVELEDMCQKYPKAEQYLTLMKESDRALAYLIQYFQDVEEDVIIAFFGDHLPSVEQEFYEELAGGKTKEQLQLDMHTVPFFVWANYDIEEQTEVKTSVNYLTNYIYDVAGISKPSYNLFLEQLQVYIPVVSFDKVYSVSEAQYVDSSALVDCEAELWQQYHYLVYNAVYDVESRSQMFRGTEE